MPREPGRVKPAREQERTRVARGAVIAAAAELFGTNGYTATTLDAVSERSLVPSATVYRLFGSKIGILKAWLDVSIAGDDAPVAVADRREVTALAGEGEPVRVIAGFAGVVTAINRRSNAVWAILAQAALADREAADLLATIARQRAAGQRRLTGTLAGLDALRAGLGEREAADIVHALMSPDVYRLLVADRRWSARRYQAWLTRTLRDQLLE